MGQTLARLGAEQQVALLFVALFGVLAAVSVAVALRGLRDGSERARERQRGRVRELRALWIGAVVFWLGWVSGPVGATLLFATLSFFALREFITLVHTRRGDHRALILAFFAVLPLQYLLAGLRADEPFMVFVPVYAFLALPVVAALAGDPGRFFERNAKVQWGVMVCVYGLSHAPALLLLELPRWDGRGAFLLFFLVVAVVAAQLAQDAAARWLRQRPLARRIDRRFSARAWSLGVGGAAAAGAALFWITPMGPATAAAMAAAAGGSGTLGALVMQALKADAGVRSWGGATSVTGAVGLLDRLAPLCFAAPVFFHAVRWTFD